MILAGVVLEIRSEIVLVYFDCLLSLCDQIGVYAIMFTTVIFCRDLYYKSPGEESNYNYHIQFIWIGISNDWQGLD